MADASLMTGIALAYTIAALVPSLDAANALLPLYVATCLYFGGFLIVTDKIPKGWLWYSYTVFLRYGWTALMVNQFQDNDSKLSAGSNGILEFYGLENQDKWANFGWLCLIFSIVALIGACAMQFIDYSRR